MLQIKLSVIFGILLVAYVTAIPFTDCGSEYNLSSVDIEGCNELPCPLFMETSTNVNVYMTSGFTSRVLTQDIKVTVQGIKNSIASNPGPCTTGRPCPVLPGNASFKASIYVPDLAPFDAVLRWIITNEDSRTVMCFSVKVVLCEKNSEDLSCYQDFTINNATGINFHT